MAGRKRRVPLRRRVRRALTTRNEWTDEVARRDGVLNYWVEQVAKGRETEAAICRMAWARIQLAEALRAMRAADRRLVKLMLEP